MTTSEAGEQLRVHRKQIIVMCERGALTGALAPVLEALANTEGGA